VSAVSSESKHIYVWCKRTVHGLIFGCLAGSTLRWISILIIRVTNYKKLIETAWILDTWAGARRRVEVI